MLRLCRHSRAPATVVNVDQYLMHLFPVAGQAITPIDDCLPAGNSTMNDVVAFHKILVERMAAAGHTMTGIMVVPPGADVLKALNHSTPVCTPVFSSQMRDTRTIVASRQSRVQHCEVALGFVVKQQPQLGRLLCRQHCGSVFPSLVLTGSRFPLFPPHGFGYAADMASLAHVVTGPVVAAPREVANHGCVLLRDREPVKVGYPKACLGSAETVLEMAGSYADTIRSPLKEGMFVLMAGLHGKVPTKKGNYEGQLGPLGSVVATIA